MQASFLVDKVGCDVGLNYRSNDFAKLLEKECSSEVAYFWDSVGGDVSDTVITNMKEHSTIILCGAISDYNETNKYPPPLSDKVASIVAERNITRHRHLVVNYEKEVMKALFDLAVLVSSGQLTHFETSEKGLINAGVAYERLMKGENLGKMVVYMRDVPPGNSLKRSIGSFLGRIYNSLKPL
eukprot:m.2765 g.2765  ORF g.2765 m.2765 type:complete len:183 (+) comp2585_c0_seq1:749-1297(+)